MDAHTLLTESLEKLNARFQALVSRHFTELQPLGDEILKLNANATQPESFVSNLKSFANVIIEVRKKALSEFRKNPTVPRPLKDLPTLPYDLWLPFKANAAAAIDTAGLDKVTQVFNAKIDQLAECWEPFHGSGNNQLEPDPDLRLLRGRIMEQFEKCNTACCVAAKFDLFSPPLTAYNDLFERKIGTRVSSADDFRHFVTCLHEVFGEGLPRDVREWQVGQELPERLREIPDVIHLIKGDIFRSIRILRNKLNHADSDASKSQTLAPIYDSLIQVKSIDRDAKLQWQALQRQILESLAQTLEELTRAFPQSARSRRSRHGEE